HPNPGNRQAAIEKEVSNWPPKNYAGNSQAFVRAKQDASTVRRYTGEQIAEGSKQGLWAQQNRQNGVIPPDLPKTSSEPTGGSLANVSFPQVRPARHLTRLE